jgi:hypothetical protein
MALAALGFASLLIKRRFERPRRNFNVWILDVCKQAFSGGCAHMLGIVNSGIVDGITNATPDSRTGNHCSWYFIAFTLDTTFGVMFAYCGIQVVEKLAHKWDVNNLKETGRYGDPPDKKVWAVQMLVWCIITIVARMFVLVLMLIAKDPLSWVSQQIAWPFRDDPKLFLVLVMIGCPLCMNALQLWIQDAFLRWKEWSAIPIGSAGAFSKIGSDRAYVTRTSRGS